MYNGGFANIRIDDEGKDGGNDSSLRLVNAAEGYTDGQVWEGFRKDWVWETGIGWTGSPPIQVSGVYIDDIFYEPNDIEYGHYIDYPNGRIVFDEAIDTTKEVKVEYSYKNVQVRRADECEWFNEVQYQAFRSDNPDFSRFDKGSYDVDAAKRVQLPVIVLEATPHTTTSGYELGNSALEISKDVYFWVIAENRTQRNDLIDTLIVQTDKSIWLYNTNTIAENEDYPLDFRGMLVGTQMYDQLVDVLGYRWKKCQFTDGRAGETRTLTPYLFTGLVKMTCKVIIGNL